VSSGTQKPAFAIGVPNDINAFHYYTVCSSFLFALLVLKFQRTSTKLSFVILPLTIKTTDRYALRPIIPDNARGLCITAAAGTELATSYSAGTIKIFPCQKDFTTRRPSSSTRRRWFRVSPIDQNSKLLPPVGVWAVSQSQCGGPSSQIR
jgi:hypothetical protein